MIHLLQFNTCLGAKFGMTRRKISMQRQPPQALYRKRECRVGETEVPLAFYRKRLSPQADEATYINERTRAYDCLEPQPWHMDPRSDLHTRSRNSQLRELGR